MQPRTLALFTFALAACGAHSTPVTHGQPPGDGTPITITLPRASFAADGEVTVSIWDQPQLELRDRMGACVVSSDDPTPTCPDGVTYQAPTPEVFTFPTSALDQPIALVARTLVQGQRYEIQIGGRSSDGCNTVGGSADGTLATPSLTLADVPLATTDMACLPR